MKKLIFILTLALTPLLFGQELKRAPTTLAVSTTQSYDLNVTEYRSNVNLNFTESQYDTSYFADFEGMKQAYFKKLEAAGLDPKALTENKTEYLRSQRRGDGMVYEFVTTSEEEITKFTAVNIPGAYPGPIDYKMAGAGKEYDESVEQALEDAEKQAKTLAGKMNKKIDRVQSVEIIQNSLKSGWTSYREKGYLTLRLVYELD